MDLYHAVIFGIVEGVTEFLPISSTGHLILVSKLLKIEQTEFVKTFEIAIQSGAIVAVLLLYGKSLVTNFNLLKKVFVAFIPTAIVGLAFYKIIKLYFIGNLYITLSSLFIGGIVLIWFELYLRKRIKQPSRNSAHVEYNNLSYANAFIIGLVQSISVIPGVSRAGATIIGGLFMGLSRTQSVEFSFLLAIPTLLAATAFDLVKNANILTASHFQTLFIGFMTSLVIAILVIKWFLSYIKRSTFISFGIYRIAVSVLFYLFITD